MLSALRSYFRFLTDADKKVPIPADAIKLIKTEKVISNVAELDELISLIESPENFETKKNVRYRNRAMLELLFSTGMRISELINLDLEDLKLDESKKVIQDERIFITGKGKKQRFVYLTERAKHYLERYLMTRDDDYKALFIPYCGSRLGPDNAYTVRVSVNYLQYKIKQYRSRLGINIPTSAHSLRHGFATYLSENGANPASIQRLLGHESLQTTSRYVHTSDRVAQKSHKQFHPLKE
jgi:site-specific recombinase XerD